MSDKIPYRQIHLDFHTNPTIEDVGDRFDREEFAKTLTDARVNSINLFTKCHHGMFTYPTKLGTMHPALKFDLFGEQMKACREHGIRALAYTCVAWNEDWCDRRPDWLCVGYDGLHAGKAPFRAWWRRLCITNPEYRKQIKAELKEVYDNYRPDGFWLDIIMGFKCICPACRAEMRALGLNPENQAHVIRHDRLAEIDYCRDMYGYIKSMDPSLEVFFNSYPYKLDDALDTEISSAEKRRYYSFVDIESLPSEDWGYNHFPIAANYVGKYDPEVTMMNGKFHLSWGDFGTLRNKEALEYECFRALAYGAKVCVGDQLHPCGRLDPVVYSRIGEVFASIKRKEPWLRGTKKVREVGVFITNEESPGHSNMLALEGAYQVLSELHIPFDYLNCFDDLEKYRLLILPDRFSPPPELTARINEFAKNGGKVLLTGSSGLDAATGKYALNFINAEFAGESEYDFRYLRLDPDIFTGVPAIDHMTYEKSYVINSSEPRLAEFVAPYFNRTWERFCSHKQTPPELAPSGEPAIVKGENYILVSPPLFADYAKRRYQAHRMILEKCIGLLLENPLVAGNLPHITEVAVRENESEYVLHLLNYVVQRKAKNLDTVEEKFLVKDAKIKLRTNSAPTCVAEVPSQKPLPFTYRGGYTEIELGDISGHTMVAVGKGK